MDIQRVLIGFAVSMFGGAIVLWLLIEKMAWPYIKKHQNIAGKHPRSLTLPLGIVERGLYTTALLIGAPSWIAVWLALKVAAQWKRWQSDERASYNVFLIGNAISVAFGILGAWIALGSLPKFPIQ